MEEKNLFCIKCGKKIEEGIKFCRNCGEKVISNKEIINKQGLLQNDEMQTKTYDQEVKIQQVTTEQKDISKGSKMAIFILLVMIIICGLVYGGLEVSRRVINNPRKVIESFQKSLINSNYIKIKEIMTSSDARLEITDENLKILEDYYKANPSKLNDLCSDLTYSIETKINNQKYFSLLKVSGLNGFLGKYKICIKPAFLELSSALDNVSITVNETNKESLSTDSTKEIGPLMPGIYTINAVYTNEYLKLNESLNIDLMSNSNNTIEAEVFKAYKSVTIDTIYSDAIVIANGVNLGKTVKQLGYIVSPVDSNTNIQLQVKVDGVNYTTNTIAIGVQNTISFGKIRELEHYYNEKSIIDRFTNDLNNSVNTLIKNYENGFEVAVNSRDFSFLVPTLYPGSSLYNQQQQYINTCAANKIYEYFISAATKNIKYNPDTRTGTVDVDEVFNTITNGKSQEGMYYYSYTFTYNETTRTFQITDMIAR